MQHLADAVLDYLWFLEFSGDDECDPDTAIKLAEALTVEIERNFGEDERQALQEAAARRLQWLITPDAYGYRPLGSPTPDQIAFLENIAEGHFDGYLPEDGEED